MADIETTLNTVEASKFIGLTPAIQIAQLTNLPQAPSPQNVGSISVPDVTSPLGPKAADPSPIRILNAKITVEGNSQFQLPINKDAIVAVEMVDLDLVIVSNTGARYLLPQAALQATTEPGKSLLQFANGDNESMALQMRKVGASKPVEGGSFRIQSSEIKPATFDGEKSGTDFNLGNKSEEGKSPEKFEQLEKQIQQLTQSLQTASNSNAETTLLIHLPNRARLHAQM